MVEASKVIDKVAIETGFSCILNILESEGRGKALIEKGVCLILGTLSKLRRRRQRGHGKTKDLIGRTIAQHVCFKTLYIS